MPVASKPLDGRLRREAAMIGELRALYASSVEPLGLTSLGRLDGPAAAVQHGTGGGDKAEPPVHRRRLCCLWQSEKPTALPLFATGIGGLGLLGWRRKRKAQAVA